MKKWLYSPVEKDELRYETLLKLFFGSEIGKEGTLEHIKNFENKIRKELPFLKNAVNQLEKINSLRNRIAHHEPICFVDNQPVISTIYARQHYNLILQLFQWMNIDELSLLYGLDHITTVCNEIDSLV